MVTKVLGKINGRLEFIFRKKIILKWFLTMNAVQFPNTTRFWLYLLRLVSKFKPEYRKKVQIAQNKCIRFCLFLESMAHIGVNEFHKINWLPTRECFEQCVSVGVYKFCKSISPPYMSDVFVKIDIRYNTVIC